MMKCTTIEGLVSNIYYCDEESVKKVINAYQLARKCHNGQKRISGEDYVLHPLSVANILARLGADSNTICAALLHDTLEDTSLDKKEIIELFGGEVANLVESVTKKDKKLFFSKYEQELFNNRKLLTYAAEDMRVIILKLADRLHNMRTMDCKTPIKQLENAEETLTFFVPLARNLGLKEIESELMDLSFKYIDREKYEKLNSEKEEYLILNNVSIGNELKNIKQVLINNNIEGDVKLCVKTNYEYCNQGGEPIRIEVILKEGERKINIDSKYQVDVMTEKEWKIDKLGLFYDWTMVNDAVRDCSLYCILQDLIQLEISDEDFMKELTEEVITEKIKVFIVGGSEIKLPSGSNVIDFAYRVDPALAQHMLYALVNGKVKELTSDLKENDRVLILTDEKYYGPKENLFEKAHTNYVKRKMQNCYFS